MLAKIIQVLPDEPHTLQELRQKGLLLLACCEGEVASKPTKYLVVCRAVAGYQVPDAENIAKLIVDAVEKWTEIY